MQVCLEALVQLIRGNAPGRDQLLALAGVHLTVRLLKEASSNGVAAGAANLLALLAGAGNEAQSEVRFLFLSSLYLMRSPVFVKSTFRVLGYRVAST